MPCAECTPQTYEWNDKAEDFATHLATNAQMWAIVHGEAQNSYLFWNQVLGTPHVIIGAVVASSIFIALAEDCDTRGPLLLVISIVELLDVILAALYVWLKYETQANTHGEAQSKGLELVQTIEQQLIFDRTQRADAKVFLQEAREQLNAIRNTPPIPDRIIKRYFKGLDEALRVDAQLREVVVERVHVVEEESKTPPTPTRQAPEFFDEEEKEPPDTRTHKIERYLTSQFAQRGDALKHYQMRRLQHLLGEK